MDDEYAVRLDDDDDNSRPAYFLIFEGKCN